MLYLGKTEKEKHNYIVAIIDNGDTFSIKFADGTIYGDYEKSEENLKIINDVMEIQIAEAKEEKMYFEGKSAVTIIATLAATATSAWIIEELSISLANTDPKYVTIAAGITVVTGFISGGIFIYENAKKLKEIEKFTLRNYIKEDLDNINQYQHALLGVRKKILDLVKESTDPFSAINSDCYKVEDLQKIWENIEREKACKIKVKSNK